MHSSETFAGQQSLEYFQENFMCAKMWYVLPAYMASRKEYHGNGRGENTCSMTSSMQFDKANVFPLMN
jgi:hypothetical protein